MAVWVKNATMEMIRVMTAAVQIAYRNPVVTGFSSPETIGERCVKMTVIFVHRYRADVFMAAFRTERAVAFAPVILWNTTGRAKRNATSTGKKWEVCAVAPRWIQTILASASRTSAMCKNVATKRITSKCEPPNVRTVAKVFSVTVREMRRGVACNAYPIRIAWDNPRCIRRECPTDYVRHVRNFCSKCLNLTTAYKKRRQPKNARRANSPIVLSKGDWHAVPVAASQVFAEGIPSV